MHSGLSQKARAVDKPGFCIFFEGYWVLVIAGPSRIW